MEKTETRCFPCEIRRAPAGDGPGKIIGYAAVFDSLSVDLGGFREELDPHAFDDVLDADVRATFNHDPSRILGRTSSGTLKLSVDDHGLKFEIDAPDTADGTTVTQLVDRGDVDQASFMFDVAPGGEEWRKDDDVHIRRVTKIKRLADISVVTFPAYPDTTAATRSLVAFMTTREKPIPRAGEAEKLIFAPDAIQVARNAAFRVRQERAEDWTSPATADLIAERTED